MKAKTQKQQKRIGTRDRGAWVRSCSERLLTARTDLQRNPGSKRGAAELTRALLATTRLRVPRLSERDVILGATAAAALTAFAVGMTHTEFAAWLRRYAAHIDKRSAELEQ
jgi:hypothetical protein